MRAVTNLLNTLLNRQSNTGRHRIDGRRRQIKREFRVQPLEERRLLTDISGVIDSNTAFTDPNDPITVVGDVQVRNGATLTFGAGVVITQQSTSFEIHVGDDDSGAGLAATGATFNAEVMFHEESTGSLTNNIVNQPFVFDDDSTSAVAVTDNTFNANPRMQGEFVPRMAANTFAANSNIQVINSIIDVDTNWPTIANVAQFRLVGDVAVRNGAVLTVADGSTVQSAFDSFDLKVSNDNSGAGLAANDVMFSAVVGFSPNSSGSVTNSVINGPFTIEDDSTSALVFESNSFEVDPRIHPEFTQRMPLNTFAAGSVIDVIGGTIDVDTLWTNIPNVAQYRLVGDVAVRNGAMLTVADGSTVQSAFDSFDLKVSNDNSGAGLTANDVTFSAVVGFSDNSSGSVTNSVINGQFTFEDDSTSVLVFESNSFEVDPRVQGEFIERMPLNTFASGSIINVLGGIIDVDTSWANIPNVAEYRLVGDVRVRNGATLTLADATTVQAEFNSWELFIADDSSGAALTAANMRFIAELIASDTAVLDLKCVEFRSNPVLESGSTGAIDRGIFSQSTLFISAASTVDVFDGNFVTGQVEAIRDSGATIDLSGNWWGTRSDTAIEQKTLHEPDDNRRPLVTWTPILNWDPKNPPAIIVTETDGETVVDETPTSDSFDVTLAARPIDPVVIDVLSNDEGEVTVEPTVLTFTAQNWATPQTVQVHGVDDPVVDGTISTVIDVTLRVAESDIGYVEAAADEAVIAMTFDNDVADFIVDPVDEDPTVTEAGSSTDLEVWLNAVPLSDVVLQVSSEDVSETSVAPEFLTFSPATWDTPQIVTVSGQDDIIADGSVVSDVKFTVIDADSNDFFDDVVDQLIPVTTLDDDAGFTITETDGSTTTSESGDNDDSILIHLNAEPVADIIFSIVSDNADEFLPNPTTLTFSPTNWETSQSVAVQGIDDFFVDGDSQGTLTISVDANSHSAFTPLAPQFVTVTNIDNDLPGFEFQLTDGSTVVSEDETTDSVLVALTSGPLTDVIIRATASDDSEVSVGIPELTFTPDNWDTPQPFTVFGVDDTILDGDQTTSLTLEVLATSDAAFQPLDNQSVSVTTSDNDVATFQIMETNDSTELDENGGTDSVLVVLNVQPLESVVLNSSLSSLTELSIAPTALTFDPENWNVPQTLTFTGLDNDFVDGDQLTELTLTVDSDNSHPSFANAPPQSVMIRTIDDDVASLSVTPESITVGEDGTTADVTLTLSARPLTPVVFNIVGSDDGEAQADSTAITFDSENWINPQILTITGIDDDVVDGDQPVNFQVSVDALASDPAFADLTDMPINVMNEDNDSAGISISPIALSLEESGTGLLNLQFAAAPLTDVVLSIESSDPNRVTPSVSRVTVTPNNWQNIPNITVQANENQTVEGEQSVTLQTRVVPEESDAAFVNFVIDEVVINQADNDVAGFVLNRTNLSLNENGAADSFTVVLSAEPVADVIFNVTTSADDRLTVEPTTLTLTPENWDSPQLISVSATDNSTIDGELSVDIVVQPTANSAFGFRNLTEQTVAAVITDNDAAGFSLSETTVSVSETNTTNTFTVVLDAQPQSNVVVSVSHPAEGDLEITPNTLTFTPLDWNAPQTVSAVAVDDMIVEGPKVFLQSCGLFPNKVTMTSILSLAKLLQLTLLITTWLGFD